ncbi:MAG: GIY-YIG nuclease family protein, partial [Planctomycetaceae bacterium]|nr:GIY-YIG nuclease family protein [Planctomycetaceae bacterium]
KKELDRLAAEERAIEAALAAALKQTQNEHSAEVEELKRQLQEAQERGQRAMSQAQLTKSGNVYVISNIGSFGDGVFKVGLTRRLEPLDRVKELGDASVPFPFDVHMMISSEDAPKLEHTLHKALNRYRVNRVNFRKEFFRVDLDTIITAVEANHGVVEYVADAEALQYRQGLEMSEDDFEFLTHAADETGIDEESDEVDEGFQGDDD